MSTPNSMTKSRGPWSGSSGTSSNGSPNAWANGCPIPSPRRMLINDVTQLPFDYSSTPGGTLFSTTPGGTRIIYERSFLIQMRGSPVAKTPPKNLPLIPGVTISGLLANGGKENKQPSRSQGPAAAAPSPCTGRLMTSGVEKSAATAGPEAGDEPQFSLDM